MTSNISHDLEQLYRRWYGQPAEHITPLDADGSSRKYFRITDAGRTVIGAYNADYRENVAFVTLSRHFKKYDLPVPEIYTADLDYHLYLQQDLGDDTLFSIAADIRKREGFSDRLIGMYRQVLDILPRFQIEAGRDLDYTVCYPRSRFDEQSIRWDLNYFKYSFLKLASIPFDEQALEDDFDRFIRFLMAADCDYFLYRDFQSRNVMWLHDRPYFIDYQGGRKGALQYDVASLLLDAKVEMPWPVREELLEYYMQAVAHFLPVSRETFLNHYYGYAFIRVMQAFGAYGLRGLYEGKSHFLRSIPPGIDNLEGLLERARLPVRLPALTGAWERLVRSESLRRIGRESGPGLTAHIRSFSYKEGIPRDETGHGGGFVFDCRVLPNPGRYPEYASLTGRDEAVIAYLEKESTVQKFLRQTDALVDQAVAHHLSRRFTDLTIHFGCTGGRHRSVYCAERIAARLRERGDIIVDLRHREQDGL